MSVWFLQFTHLSDRLFYLYSSLSLSVCVSLSLSFRACVLLCTCPLLCVRVDQTKDWLDPNYNPNAGVQKKGWNPFSR